jgi:hypothetical protein
VNGPHERASLSQFRQDLDLLWIGLFAWPFDFLVTAG